MYMDLPEELTKKQCCQRLVAEGCKQFLSLCGLAEEEHEAPLQPAHSVKCKPLPQGTPLFHSRDAVRSPAFLELPICFDGGLSTASKVRKSPIVDRTASSVSLVPEQSL